MKYTRRILITALTLALAAGCSDDTSVGDSAVAPDSSVDSAPAFCDTSAFLPGDSVVGDFVVKGTPKAAANAAALNLLINGGSVKYSDNKFVCMVEAFYTSATKSYQIKVWIFDQTNNTGATAAYTATGNASFSNITPTIGDTSRENLKLPLDYMADVIKGKYLIRVQSDDPAAHADGLAMLKAIVALIK